MKPMLFPMMATLFALSLGAAEARDRTVSVQGSNGRGYTATTGGSYDSTTGTWSRSGTATTNGGQTVSRTATGGCVNTGGAVVCDRSATATGANGSVTTSGSASYADGTGTGTVTRTGPNGKTVTRTRWISVAP